MVKRVSNALSRVGNAISLLPIEGNADAGTDGLTP